MSANAGGEFERRIRFLSVAGAAIALAALSAGLVLSWSDAPASRVLLLSGITTLVMMPVVNVLAALVEEVRRRDWTFVAAALAVLAILVYNVSNTFL